MPVPDDAMNYENALRHGINFVKGIARITATVVAAGTATAKYLAIAVCGVVLLLALLMGVGRDADFEHGTLDEDETEEIPLDDEEA